MNLRLIEQFVVVAELGSLSRAATRLHVAQPSLSRGLRQLETELGAPLFHRHGRGLTLTDAGHAFLQHGRAALHELEAGQAAVSDLAATPRGMVVIGLPAGVGKAAMVEVARRFNAKLPRASLRIMEMFTGDVPEALATGRIDIGVFYESPTASTVMTEPAMTEELYLVGAASAAATQEERLPFAALSGLPLILPARHQGLRGLVNGEAARRGMKLHVRMELDAMPPLLELVQEGIGYSILPFSTVFDLVQRGVMRASCLDEPALRRKLLIGTSSQRPMSATTRMTLRLLREALVASAVKGRWQWAPGSVLIFPEYGSKQEA